MKTKEISKSQWIKFGIVAALYLLFTIWVGNYWLLFGIPIIIDIYLTRFIRWGAWKESKKPAVKKVMEWVDAILFALVAVYIINLFIFQNYKIPTSSLEKTLLVGDYLFVSKLSYGPRVPNTPLSFPLAQHTLPILECKSYFDWPQWDYKRLKGFGDVKRNDIVVFNFPAGDTVALKEQGTDFYSLCQGAGRDMVLADKERFGDIVYRPVDRRENYVKRCIGMPGDSLSVIDNAVYIDGKKLQDPENMQLCYLVDTEGANISLEHFHLLNISDDDIKYTFDPNVNRNVYVLPLTKKSYQIISRLPFVKSVRLIPDHKEGIYPLDYETGWSRDNYGPIWIPKKGATIVLNEQNLALYSRCIINYEGNTLRKENGTIYINNVPANNYTFRYDYYFMLGDNRHNSADSRYWGFVPEDHVVGKPILVWLSIDKDFPLFSGGIRWNRLFKMVHSD